MSRQTICSSKLMCKSCPEHLVGRKTTLQFHSSHGYKGLVVTVYGTFMRPPCNQPDPPRPPVEEEGVKEHAVPSPFDLLGDHGQVAETLVEVRQLSPRPPPGSSTATSDSALLGTD